MVTSGSAPYFRLRYSSDNMPIVGLPDFAVEEWWQFGVGIRIADSWRTRPAEILGGPARTVPVELMLATVPNVPVLTEEARIVLAPAMENSVELLPVRTSTGETLWLVNVLVVADVLDYDRSDVKQVGIDGIALGPKVRLRSNAEVTAPIFTLPQPPGDIPFVRRSLVELIQRERLVGWNFEAVER